MTDIEYPFIVRFTVDMSVIYADDTADGEYIDADGNYVEPFQDRFDVNISDTEPVSADAIHQHLSAYVEGTFTDNVSHGDAWIEWTCTNYGAYDDRYVVTTMSLPQGIVTMLANAGLI